VHSTSSGDEDNMSTASTPTRCKSASNLCLRLADTGDALLVAEGVDNSGLNNRQPMPVLEGTPPAPLRPSCAPWSVCLCFCG
jgi:hypothetical protein